MLFAGNEKQENERIKLYSHDKIVRVSFLINDKLSGRKQIGLDS